MWMLIGLLLIVPLVDLIGDSSPLPYEQETEVEEAWDRANTI